MPHGRTILLMLAAARIAACEEPDRSGVQGTYDVSAMLDSFTYQIPGSAPGVDCAPSKPYCARTEGAKGASLSIVLYVGDFYDAGAGGEDIFKASATTNGSFCSAVDKLDGCTGQSPSSLAFGSSYMEAGAYAVQMRLSTGLGIVPFIALKGSTLQGDSMSGDLTWRQNVNGDTAFYVGRYVAHKRK